MKTFSTGNLWHIITGIKPASFFKRISISASILVIYAFMFNLLYHTSIHSSVIAFALIPIFFISNMFGILGGAIVGLLIIPINWLLLSLAQSSSLPGAITFDYSNFWISHGFFLVVGLLFGYLHDIHKQLHKELDERRKAEEELEYMATHDPLTGIPNRTMFYQCAENAISRALRRGEGLAVLFIDLDNFKQINDQFGHAFGDKVLVEVGKRILATLRDSDCVARIGGDEFSVALESVWEQETISYICQRLIKSISSPIIIDGKEVNLKGSIGISQYPHNGDNIEQLLHQADTAMYSLKNNKQSNFSFYNRKLANESERPKNHSRP